MFLISWLGIQLAAGSDVRSGRAVASWLSAASGYVAGGVVKTAVVIESDKGWHTYWSNPGESGIPTEMTFDLPDGWKVVETGAPPPMRFEASGLASFGYAGRTYFPVTLQAPQGAAGKVVLKASLTWLACDDGGCVPGDAELSLELADGAAEATEHRAEIERALERLPVADHGFGLEVVDRGSTLEIRLEWVGGVGPVVDPVDCEVFPVSAERIRSAEVPRFRKVADGWVAEVAKSEYLSGAVPDLRLLLVDRKRGKSVSVGWRADPAE